MELYTDAASSVDFGGSYEGKWFASSWPRELLSPISKFDAISMAFMELYPIIVAAILGGNM